MMKILIAIAICLLLSKVEADEDEAEKIKRIQRECALENGIDLERAESLEDNHKLYRDKKDRCYLKCIYGKWDLIDNEGMVNREELEEEFEDVKNISAILHKCNEETMKVKDVCDRVFKLQTCILEEEAAQEEAEFQEVSENCVKEMGLDLKILERLQDEEIYKNKKNKCLLKCIYTGMEYMDDHGKINRDLWEEYFYEADGDVKQTKAKLSNCLSKYDDETDLCEKAYKFSTCMEN